MTRRRGILLVVAAVLALAACARYQPEPLSARHPAHPDAPAAPEPAPSQTLAYTPAVPAVPAPGLRPSVAAPVGGATVVGEGEVVTTSPKASQIVVDHGEIAGFMQAMTMGYRVEPASLLAGLSPGDKVRFTIDVRRRAIIRLEKLP